MADDAPKPRHALPRFLRDEGLKADRTKRSRKHEGRVAKALGGKRLPSSGAKSVGRFSQWGGGKYGRTASQVTPKGDVVTLEFMVEHKFVEPTTKSMSVTRDWLKKVSEGARCQMKTPVMVLTFERPDQFEQDWLLIPLSAARKKLGFEDV